MLSRNPLTVGQCAEWAPVVLHKLRDGRWHDVERLEISELSPGERRQCIFFLQKRGAPIEYRREGGKSSYRLKDARWQLDEDGDEVEVVEAETVSEVARSRPMARVDVTLVKLPLSGYSTGELLEELKARNWEITARKRWNLVNTATSHHPLSESRADVVEVEEAAE